MRIEIDLNDEQRQRVKRYADEQGLKMPRAYAELVEIALDQATDGDGDG